MITNYFHAIILAKHLCYIIQTFALQRQHAIHPRSIILCIYLRFSTKDPFSTTTFSDGFIRTRSLLSVVISTEPCANTTLDLLSS